MDATLTNPMTTAPPGDNGPDPAAFVRRDGQGLCHLTLAVENVHCASCIAKIEGAAKGFAGVSTARLNLTTGRMSLTWEGEAALGRSLVSRINGLGYPARPFDPDHKTDDTSDAVERELLWCLSVSGAASGFIMVLSVGVWAGLVTDMGEATRTLMHWFSALIALPVTVYAGRPFFRAAWAAVRTGGVNMDVPISLAVILAAAVSVSETIQGGRYTYFDASVMLLFFLLIGRYLDHRARSKARGVASDLLALRATTAQVLDAQGQAHSLPVSRVQPDDRVLVAVGDRIPLDGVIEDGASSLDTALITGETLPVPVKAGDIVIGGTLNLDGPLTVRVTAAAEDSTLAGIVRIMEDAAQSQSRTVRLADRIAKLYVPLVHALALGAFLGWWLLGDVSVREAVLIAVTVLIITCPCALGLAIPVVQVVASGRLMRGGILLTSGDGLERSAQVDTVVFDKTGTLTVGRPTLLDRGGLRDADLLTVAKVARFSRHPLSQAIVRAVEQQGGAIICDGTTDVADQPGLGVMGRVDGVPVRVGTAAFVGAPDAPDHDGPQVWVRLGEAAPVRLTFEDPLRDDAAAVIAELRRQGYALRLLSGDRTQTAQRVGQAVGLGEDEIQGDLTPQDKVAVLDVLQGQGHRVLMVGDGLNDAPALTAAHASMAPASGTDITQTAADMVFQGEALAPVQEGMHAARRARTLVRQNVGLAVLYNGIAVPIALAGLVTPLIAAVAMAVSSLCVTLNALRLQKTRS